MKKSFLSLLLTFISIILFAQTGEIRGVITYEFNKYQGDKPDIGAKVCVVDSTIHTDSICESLHQLRLGKAYVSYYNNNCSMIEKCELLLKSYGGKRKNAAKIEEANSMIETITNEKDKFYAEMVKLNIETDSKLKDLEINVTRAYMKVINKKETIRRTIGSTGEYSIKISPGIYYVFIKSNNRKGNNLSNFFNEVYCKKVEIESDEVKDVSCNFN